MHEKTEEYMYMLCLNNRNEMTSLFEISHGTVNSSLITPREVYQKALLANAVSILVIHNHPSGETIASEQDYDVTVRLKKVGEILGVNLLDHIIVGNGYFSFKEDGKVF